MNIHDVKVYLQNQFDLVCFVDLEDLKSSYGAVFGLFQQHYKPIYQHIERLVLFSQHRPTLEFLNHIQKAATEIDISNFFILIVTPWDVSQELAFSNNKFGNDQIPIQQLILPVSGTKPAKEFIPLSYDKICPFPFLNVSVQLGSKASPCCKFQKLIGDLNYQTLQEIFNSEDMNFIRDQMIQGIKLPECSICWDNEDKGTTSLRQLALQKYQKIFFQEDFVNQPRLRELTISPDSTCNFKCRICTADASSKIAEEELRFSNEKERSAIIDFLSDRKTIGLKKFKKLLEDKEFENIQGLHILGGEPFLWPEFIGCIESLIEKNQSSNISLTIHTNGSIFPKYIDRLIDNFKLVHILLSVDDIESRFEIQRGGRWKKINSNIQKFADLQSSTVKVDMSPTINVQNVFYLDELVCYAESLNLGLVWWYLETPKFLCIDNTTIEAKKLIYNKYFDHPDPELKKVAQRVKNSAADTGQDFCKFVLKMDLRRSQNFQIHHNEIWQAMQPNF